MSETALELGTCGVNGGLTAGGRVEPSTSLAECGIRATRRVMTREPGAVRSRTMQASTGADMHVAQEEGADWRPWPSLLTPEGLRLSREVLQRTGAPELAELVGAVGHGAAAPANSTSRQAFHARLQRTQSTVAAGALLLAGHSRTFTDFVLSRDFPLLRPMSAATHMKVRHLVGVLPRMQPESCLVLFERCFAALTQTARRLDPVDDGEVLRMHGALAGMHAGPVLFGSAFRDAWATVHTCARSQGLLDHPYLQMHLVLMGSYVGQWQAHRAWLDSPGNHELDIGHILLFVRRDGLPEIAKLQARLLRGQRVTAQSCLYSRRPWSTLSLLVDHIAGCLRETGHLESPGLTLRELGWVHTLRRDMASMLGGPVRDGDRQGLENRLSKLERIQVMEKRRFWQMVDGPLPLELKERLSALWCGARIHDASADGADKLRL